MKTNLFENKYRPSNAAKIFFVDIVCFLLVAFISIGVCYAYFSHKLEVGGFSTMANVNVQYQYDVTEGNYQQVNTVYGKVNNEDERDLAGVTITPGDTITIVGRAVNTSNVSVYVLAKLTIVTSKGTINAWYNIGSNAPVGAEAENPDALPNAIETEESKQLYKKSMTTASGKTDEVYQVGAGVLGGSYKDGEITKYRYKELAIPYTFEGEEYENGDTITSITLTLHVHQRDYLDAAEDFISLYKPHASNISQANPNGFINGYTTESIYAVHQITGDKLV